MKQTNIAITSLHPFAGNPYQVRDDAEMDALIESIREYKDSLVRYTMNEAEIALITQSPRPEETFTRLWTMKEAVLKLSGEGLRNDMKTVLTGRERIETVVNTERGYVYSVVG